MQGGTTTPVPRIHICPSDQQSCNDSRVVVPPGRMVQGGVAKLVPSTYLCPSNLANASTLAATNKYLRFRSLESVRCAAAS